MRLNVLNETWVVGCNFGKPTRCWSNLDYHRMFLMLQQVIWLLKHLKPSNRIEKSNRMLCNCVVARLIIYCTSHFGNHPDSIITICSRKINTKDQLRKLVKFRHETPSMWNTAAINQSQARLPFLVDQLSTLVSCEHFRQFARPQDQIFWTFKGLSKTGVMKPYVPPPNQKRIAFSMDVYPKIIYGKRNMENKTYSHRSSSSCSHSVMFPLGTMSPWPKRALFLSHVNHSTCQVAIEVNVWDAGIEIIDGQCCRGGLFREAWCFPSRHGGTPRHPSC